MSTRVEPAESPRQAIPRVIRSLIDKALDDLKEIDEPAVAVHSARKRLKRLRALLRLARPGMDRATFDREKNRLRDAARPLGEARDAAVLVATLDALGPSEAVDASRGAFLDRQSDATRSALGEGSALDQFADSVREARDALGPDAFAGLDRRALRAGLRRVDREFRRAAREAREAPTDATLHEWRKRVKDLAYALDALRPIDPAVVGRRANLADELAEALGDDHDLAVLRAALLAGDGTAGAVVELLPVIDARRAKLQATAYRLGREVGRDRPREFAGRLSRAWRRRRRRKSAR